MIIKWCLWGAAIGVIVTIACVGFSGVIMGAILGGAAGIYIRKWIFKTFWK